MGVAPSKDNEELVDRLVKSDHLRSPQIELAFRLVDRGDFVPKKFLKEIYGDQPFKVRDFNPWGPRDIHMSAPCMYACVLEELDIQKGNAFLNIGSGTGWLNTVCGFLVGEKGINHGVEIHSDLVEYADDLMNTMMIRSGAVAGFEWCKPKFMHGNGLTLKNADNFEGYDRLYCGASIRDPNTVFRLMRLLKVGGQMVAPFHSVLFSFVRTSQSTIRTENVTTCQFADLVLPEPRTPLRVLFTCQKPMPLKLISRYYIRQELRRKTDRSHDFVVPLKINKEKDQLVWSSDEFRHTSLEQSMGSSPTASQSLNPRMVPNPSLPAQERRGRPFSSFFRPGINPENPEVPGTEEYVIPQENEEQKSIYIEYPSNGGESDNEEEGAVNDFELQGQQLDGGNLLDNILGLAARRIDAVRRQAGEIDSESDERDSESDERDSGSEELDSEYDVMEDLFPQLSAITHRRVTIQAPVDVSLDLMDGQTRRFRFVEDVTHNNIYGVLDPNFMPSDLTTRGPSTQSLRSMRRNHDEANADANSEDYQPGSTSPKRRRWENDSGASNEDDSGASNVLNVHNSTTTTAGASKSDRDYCECSSFADDSESDHIKEGTRSKEGDRNKRKAVVKKTNRRLPTNLLKAYGAGYQELLESLPIPKHLISFVRLEK